MKFDFNLITILDSAGFIQGFVLGILLIILNKSKHKSTFFLGLFLILFSVQRLPIIFRDLNVYEYYPEFYLLPFNFYWLLLPVFFIYTQQVSVFSTHKIQYWLLYPGILAFIIQVFIFYLPYQTKLEIAPNLWRGYFFIAGAFYSWGVGIWNLKLLQHHRKEVRNHYSMLESKELHWARIFLIFGISGTILYLIQAFLIPENIYSRISFLIFDLLVIYWVSYHGVVQRNILSIIAKKKFYGLTELQSVDVKKNPALDSKDLEELMGKINDHMMTSESYVQSELTIVDLAKVLQIHSKQISTAINKVQNQNFNSYVNQFRIKKAIILLREQDIILSIEGIGYEVGFHSKSAFYAAFKKVTGTTPTKFKEKSAA